MSDMPSRTCLAVVLALFTAACESPGVHSTAQDARAALQRTPDGSLGFPLGTYLSIEGFRTEGVNLGPPTLRVERIGDKACAPPIILPIDYGLRFELPRGVRCVLRGYESGRMVGIPGAVAEAERLPLQQTVWHFFRHFVVTSIVEPESLRQSMAAPR